MNLWIALAMTFAIVTFVVAILAVVSWLSARSVKRLAAELPANATMTTSCVVVEGASKTPGVLAIVDDRLVYRALVGKGEIPLADIEGLEVTKALNTKYSRGKYVGGYRVLNFRLRDGSVRHILMATKRVAPWQERFGGQRG